MENAFSQGIIEAGRQIPRDKIPGRKVLKLDNKALCGWYIIRAQKA
jgi:hypothetical protein